MKVGPSGYGIAWAAGLAAALALAAAASPSTAQVVKAGGLELDLTGRVQVQFSTTTVDGDDVAEPPPNAVFETRRVRLGTSFAFEDWLTGKVEADFAREGARLTDGYVDLALSRPLTVRIGQFRKPFGVYELESSTQIRTIERAVRIRGLESLVGVPGEAQWLLDEGAYLGRQIGVMGHGVLGPVAYAAGVFNGEGANAREERESKAYAARATWGPVDELELSGGVSVQPTGRFDGDDEVHGTVYAVDAVWGGFRRQGLHLKAELMTGDNPSAAGDAASLPTMAGAHGLVAWFAPQQGRVEGIEPVIRVSWGDPDTDTAGDEGMLVTPGVNLYFSGRNRLMLNGDIYVPSNEDLGPELALVAQMQVYF